MRRNETYLYRGWWGIAAVADPDSNRTMMPVLNAIRGILKSEGREEKCL